MDIKSWLRKLVIRFLSIENIQADLDRTFRESKALAGLIAEQTKDLADLRELAEQRYRSNQGDITEVEQRMMLRMAAIEEMIQSRQPGNPEGEDNKPTGGYVPWTTRMRNAERAAFNPKKWAKVTAKQE
jgi:hypothetical protein